MQTNWLTYEQVAEIFNGKTVAIVGSAPTVLENDGNYIDSHDIVVRVNNYKLKPEKTGKRTDVHYSFYGNSIKKTSDELKKDGVYLCMCKVPDANTIESEWHKKNGKQFGVDFRWIYARRAQWWFCDTYAPTKPHFMKYFTLCGNRMPTTGFQCILEILSFNISKAYITGFDFFESKIHNVNEVWRPGRLDDPIGHNPKTEKEYILHLNDDRVIYDKHINRLRDSIKLEATARN